MFICASNPEQAEKNRLVKKVLSEKKGTLCEQHHPFSLKTQRVR
jgi:hypothetical protein